MTEQETTRASADDLYALSLEYHRAAPAGKLEIRPTKPLSTQRDLALAYSPGVAAACNAIAADPAEAASLTARGNLVAVISNGTAVLGLGAIGALAGKPVMEGKAVLFKKFAGIDVFDIEIDERDPDRLVDIIAALEPTFGAINLEDIKAPECFEVETKLRRRMGIPVFHDDQHGTAICVAASVTNALRLVDRPLGEIKIVTCGAGAAALACLDLLVSMGADRANIWVCDIVGLVYEGRTELMDPYKARYAQVTDKRTLDDVIDGADLFLGLSAPGILKPGMVARMVERPIIMALANPTPEIMPEEVRAVRPGAIIGTGRSDYPNQINNVLCFPFIFRGALDVGATTINEEMKIACVKAIADLAMAETSDVVTKAYGAEQGVFGPEKLIPKPFDPRLILRIAPAVAEAAMRTGVATRPIDDLRAYQAGLEDFVFRSGTVMKPIFAAAKQAPCRVVYAEGEDERVLEAVQQLVDEGMVEPILVGRPEIVEYRIREHGLRLELGRGVEIVDPADDPRYGEYWRGYHALIGRRGVSLDRARRVMRTDTTAIAAMMVQRGDADALICGVEGRFTDHLGPVVDIIGLVPGVDACAALSLLILPRGAFFLTDTHVSPDPCAEEIVATTRLAALEMRRFGIEPKVALLSHSNFGTRDTPSALKMRRAAELLRAEAPDFEIDGEMHADVAVSPELRARVLPDSTLRGSANLFVMPNLDAANIAYNLLKQLGQGLSVGPFILGLNRPANILTNSVTVRGILNASAVTVVEASGRPAP